MNRLVIIGNGFDIAHRLKTSYMNFINRNKERDIEVQRRLAAMGWHSITIWECELKPKVREKTLESLAYTLNRIFLQDHCIKRYMNTEEKPMMAAEEIADYNKKNINDV